MKRKLKKNYLRKMNVMCRELELFSLSMFLMQRITMIIVIEFDDGACKKNCCVELFGHRLTPTSFHRMLNFGDSDHAVSSREESRIVCVSNSNIMCQSPARLQRLLISISILFSFVSSSRLQKKGNKYLLR